MRYFCRKFEWRGVPNAYGFRFSRSHCSAIPLCNKNTTVLSSLSLACLGKNGQPILYTNGQPLFGLSLSRMSRLHTSEFARQYGRICFLCIVLTDGWCMDDLRHLRICVLLRDVSFVHCSTITFAFHKHSEVSHGICPLCATCGIVEVRSTPPHVESSHDAQSLAYPKLIHFTATRLVRTTF